MLGVGPALSFSHHDPTDIPYPFADIAQHAHQLTVPGQLGELHVELLVQLDQHLRRRAGAIGRLRLDQECAQCRDAVIAGPVDGPAQRLAFDRLAHFVEFENHLGPQGTVEKSASGLEGDETLRDQPVQRFPEWGAADPERAGQRAFVDPLIRHEGVVGRHGPDLVIDPVDATFRLRSADRHPCRIPHLLRYTGLYNILYYNSVADQYRGLRGLRDIGRNPP